MSTSSGKGKHLLVEVGVDDVHHRDASLHRDGLLRQGGILCPYRLHHVREHRVAHDV